jgi:hypothetical protein
MGKLYCIHEMELHPGVDEAKFIQFFNQEFTEIYQAIGWNLSLLKGDRGQRVGKYAVLINIQNREARDRISPGHGELSEEAQRVYAEQNERFDGVFSKWATFSPTDMGAHLEYTDYIVVE